MQNILIANQQTINNDLVQGFSGANILNTGTGDDLLVGGDGADIYNYQIGNGHDVVDDNGLGDTDILQITGYLSPQATFSLLNDGSNDFIIKFNDSDSITLVNSIVSSTADEIEQITFLDDIPIKTYTTSELQTLFINQQITAGDDVITGFNSANTIPASSGNDLIFGLDGADTYQYDTGSGHDRIEDNGLGDTDKLEIFTYLPSDVNIVHHQASINTVIFNFNANDSITIVNTLNGTNGDGIEEIHFMDDPNNTIWSIADLRQMTLQQAQTTNSDYIVDFTNPDTIPSSTGIDRHIGKDGNDIYEFNLGDETLIIDDQGLGDTDEIIIAGYTSTQATYRRIVPGSNDLLIEFIGSNDRIFVMNSLSGASIHIATETITFQADGISLDIQTEIEPGILP
jgi:Ca2+-binding RTX toxin-like protein